MPNPAKASPRVTAEEIRSIVAPLAGVPGALLPMLHALNGAYGHIPPAAIVLVAEVLNLSRADVRGVVTFYHDFRTELATRPVVKLCRADVAVEAVYCLGLCASGPAAMVGDRVHARLDSGALDRLLDEVAA